MQTIISLNDAIARLPEWRLTAPVTLDIHGDEHIAIVGRNGSGKSLLADMLTSRHALQSGTLHYDFSPNTGNRVSECIRQICFRDVYGGDNDRSYYLQQRWNQTEIDENTPTVADRLACACKSGDEGSAASGQAWCERLYRLFGMNTMADKPVVLLSSGELRKLSIVTALLARPRVLVIDNPFIGLDTESRTQFAELLHSLSEEEAVQIILIVSRRRDIPSFITHVVEVKERHVLPKCTLSEYLSRPLDHVEPDTLQQLQQELGSIPAPPPHTVSDPVIHMRDVSVSYYKKPILKDINWTVHNGERWILSGRNGSGKSTLLSLICADNPQAYACDMTIFGKRRGSGESIWEVKRRIGYVSPEMHRAYRSNVSVEKIVASGLYDSVGLYVRLTPADRERSLEWLRLFGLEHLKDIRFSLLSSGEQRLVLLARTFVKDPDLLILDEPMHGLDDYHCQWMKALIRAYCQRRDKTLIMVTHDAEELPEGMTHELHLERA